MSQASTRNISLLVATVCMPIVLGLYTMTAAAASTWLVAARGETFRSDETILFDVVRPASQEGWPEVLDLRLRQDSKTWEVALSAVGPVAKGDMRRTYRGVMPPHVSGLIRGELGGVESNRLALLVREPDAIQQMMSPEDSSELNALYTERAVNLLAPVGEPALSAHEPMYFVIGNGGVARFQFSVKYRMFDTDSQPVAWLSPLANLYFSFTQSSLWDLSANSKPFRDTSYRPSVFWQGTSLGDGIKPDLLRAGFEHESNGKDGPSSRSINIFFVQPAWTTRFPDGHIFVVIPKIYVYQDKTDNPDIPRYRGYADWELGYGREDGAVLRGKFRSGTAGYSSAQIAISYPLRKALFARGGGFVYLQLFRGYGDTLLTYNQYTSTQVRLGFAIVR